MVIDPISATLAIGNLASGLLGAGAKRDKAQWQAYYQNKKLINEFNKQELLRELKNYGRYSADLNAKRVDYEINKDNINSAAARAFATEDSKIENIVNQYRLGSQQSYVATASKMRANEGGRTNASNINEIRQAGRQEGLMASNLLRAKDEAYGRNFEVARQANERLMAAHAKVSRKVQYDNLRTERPEMVQGPSGAEYAADIFNTVLGAAGTYLQFAPKKAMKDSGNDKSSTNSFITDTSFVDTSGINAGNYSWSSTPDTSWSKALSLGP